MKQLPIMIGMIALVLVTLAASALAVSAATISVSITEVKIDGTVVSPTGANTLNIEKGQRDVEVRVQFSSAQELKNMEISADISGYEYNDDPELRLSDTTPVFDMEGNVTYVKTLRLDIPNDAEVDDYLVRITVSDRNNNALVQSYRVVLSAQRHDLNIRDVITSPYDEVRAGSALLVTAYVENFGQKDERDARVTAELKGTGATGVAYIDEIEDGDTEQTEEIFLRVPRCTVAGAYQLQVDVDYDRNHKHESYTMPIMVTEDETCKSVTEQASITVGGAGQSLAQGATRTYTIAVQNTGRTSAAYTLTLSGYDSWASASVGPAAMQVVASGQTGVFTVAVTPSSDASPGSHSLTATISSGERIVQQLQLNANVTKSSLSGVKQGLMIVLLVLVGLLVILGLALGWKHINREDKKGGSKGRYY